MTVVKKKLIEVALPLDAINKASAREKSIRHGHPSTLHLWWARRPLAAARAVIFAQMVDDPSANPDLFPTEKAQEKERKRLFKIIEDLVQWESTTNERVLQAARDEIWQSWRRACAENADHPCAKELFDRHKLPAFHDPFAGGGTLPLEAQRLGLEAYASDLNPVAVLINKAMIEIPPKFADRPPVNPESQKGLGTKTWHGAQGLAEDIRYYGKWMRDEAEKRIGHLYPKIEVTQAIAQGRSDLAPLIGQELTVIGWLWARTVKSPNPAFREVDVPLASTFMLSTKPGKEAWVEPMIQGSAYHFEVRVGKPNNIETANTGTKLSRGANFRCLLSGAPISGEYIRTEGKEGRMGTRLMAIVAEGEHGRIYLPPVAEHEAVAKNAQPECRPDVEFYQRALGFRVGNYGMTKWSHVFTERQLIALNTLADVVSDATKQVLSDALATNLAKDERTLSEGGVGARAYADAVTTALGMCVSRQSNRSATLCIWDQKGENVQQVFGMQILKMTWDFVEGNPFSASTGNFYGQVGYFSKVLDVACSGFARGVAEQADAQMQTVSSSKVISTDPPYYDNIGYADLSDFFYVWLRKTLRPMFSSLFATVSTPKSEELVATPDRHGGAQEAESFFLNGMTQAMHRLATQAHPAFPISIYYAFKQSESEANGGTASTGWETFLGAVINAGFAISGTWPMRTEYTGNLKGARSALASSVVLVCRPRSVEARTTTRREFVAALQRELPEALRHLQAGNIAPVDLAQAAIGPGMAVFTRYAKVLDAKGSAISVRTALTLINETLDTALAEQEGDFDADSRWALAWFEQHGFAEGEYGVAETLSKAKNTSVSGLVDAAILESKRGKVRLLKPEELEVDWDPTTDKRLTNWETVHHLIRVLGSGEKAASEIVSKLGSKAETARELAYRLYTLCERKKRAAEALTYNSLVQSWPEISRLAREARSSVGAQTEMFTIE